MPKHLTERDLSVSASVPENPYNGQVWMDNESGKIKKYESGTWVDYSYADAKSVNDSISELERNVADLMYKMIQITSISNNKNTVEKGSTITSTSISWATNKTPSTLSLDGVSLGVNSTSYTSNVSYTNNKSFTLTATDERGASVNKSTSVTFLNGIYYGVSTRSQNDGTLISSLTKVLSESKGRTFSVNSGQGEHIFYCLPTRLGSCSFKVGGFDGGFNKVTSIQFTNGSGYTESYDIYKSTNNNLGNTSVTVS